MALKDRRRVILAVLAGLIAVGLPLTLWLTRPAPAPPAPPAPPPKWKCGTAYGEEICERGLPPVREAP